jgi:hypothetical protein
MPHPHSVYFCVSYAVCLGVISAVALHCMRRFRHPLASLVLGLAALGATFWFALWLESRLVQAGPAGGQIGLVYEYFIRAAFLVFLVFILVRGGYLLRHAFSQRSHNVA